MKIDAEHVGLEQILKVLRRRWWVIGLLVVLSAAAAFALSEAQQKRYTATASLLFQDAAVGQQAAGLQPSTNSPSQDPVVMATNIRLLTEQSQAAAETARLVGHGLTGSGILQSISVSEEGNTDVADVSATSADPVTSAAIANTFVSRFIADQRAQQQASINQGLSLVERQVAALTPQQLAGTTGQALLDRAESLRILARLQNGGAEVVSRAMSPRSPSSPRVIRNTGLGLLIGLFIGLAAAFLLERVDRRIKDVRVLEATYQLPLLATIPRSKGYTLPPGADGSHARGKEVFQLLRAYLRYFNVDRELRSLLITSAAPGEGKSTIARKLAEAAQETGTKTLLLEVDLRQPSCSSHYGIRSAPGVSEVLIGNAEVGEAIQQIPLVTPLNGARAEASLDLLSSGHIPPNPSELLESNAMKDLVAWATEQYELVIIDTPPLGAVSDAAALLHEVDGVLIVSQLGKHTRDVAAYLRERLVGMGAPLLGVVANRVSGRTARDYGYYGPEDGYYGREQATVHPELEPTRE